MTHNQWQHEFIKAPATFVAQLQSFAGKRKATQLIHKVLARKTDKDTDYEYWYECMKINARAEYDIQSMSAFELEAIRSFVYMNE